MEACRDVFAAPKKPNRLASGALLNDVDHSRAHPTDSAAQDYSNGEFDPVKVQPRRPDGAVAPDSVMLRAGNPAARPVCS